jgi:hypothetical protein
LGIRFLRSVLGTSLSAGFRPFYPEAGRYGETCGQVRLTGIEPAASNS